MLGGKRIRQASGGGREDVNLAVNGSTAASVSAMTGRSLKSPWRIIKRDSLRMTADGRFIVFARFGLMWAAKRPCQCPRRRCFCPVVRLPTVAGAANTARRTNTGFNTLKALQKALRKRYRTERRKRRKT